MRRSIATWAPRGLRTPSGVAVPTGWRLVRGDTFGTTKSVPNFATLHSLYNEGQYYNTLADGSAFPFSINAQQHTYVSFESAIAFSTDHITIQGRGQPDNSIRSAQMVSKWSDRSFIFEAKFKVPNTPGTWVEFWAYAGVNGDASELDVEIVETAIGGPEHTTQAFFFNHGAVQTSTVVPNPATFDVNNAKYSDGVYDGSTAPHTYTIYYDDTGPGTIKRYLDGQLLYTATWKWNESLGGTGFGPDAIMTIDLAVGGNWPGNVTSPSTWTGDMDIYSIHYYTSRPALVGQGWDPGHRSPGILLSTNYLTGTLQALDLTNQLVFSALGVSTGLVYWEVIISVADGAGVGVPGSYTHQGHYLGEFFDTVGWFSNGAVVTNNNLVTNWATFTGGDRLCFALWVDAARGVYKLWGRVGTTGAWNNDSNNNPALGIGGFVLPSSVRSNVLAAGDLSQINGTITGYFASGAWAGSAPAGFGSFVSPGTPPLLLEQWSPAQRTPSGFLSNNNLTFTAGTSNGEMIYGMVGHDTGKYYWELVFNTGATSTVHVGIGNTLSTTASTDWVGFQPNTLGWLTGGGVYNNNIQVDTWAAYSGGTGTRLCFALDLDNGKLWGRVGPSGNWNNAAIGSQNPATNTGGLAIPSNVLATMVVPAAGVGSTTVPDSITGAFLASSWVGTAPSGFGAL